MCIWKRPRIPSERILGIPGILRPCFENHCSYQLSAVFFDFFQCVCSLAQYWGTGIVTVQDIMKTHWYFKSLSGFPEGGSPTVDGPLPSFSSNSNLSEQVWDELLLLTSKLQKRVCLLIRESLEWSRLYVKLACELSLADTYRILFFFLIKTLLHLFQFVF